jgi:Tetracyclin repressor-like, C-terminal domain
MAIVLAVLGSFGLEGPAAIHAARCLRSAAHGFAVLETGGGFGLPEDLDASHDRLVDTLAAGLTARP